MAFSRTSEQWQAVLHRDRAADGAFVFAVKTTGVYCRPSCAARRPRRENVAFYLVPEAAEAAGFRSCRRCRPSTAVAVDPTMTKIRAVCHHIETHPDERLSLRSLGAVAGLSPHHLQRTFRRIVGVSPREYADARRFRAFKARIKKGSSVTEATYDAGYGSSSRLYERTKAHLGMTPTTYKKGGAGMSLSYEIVPTVLGRVLVAATERGIAAVCVGSQDAQLQRSLREEYPRATIDAGAGVDRRWIDAVVALAEGRPRRDDLPVDIQVTAFEWTVLRALRRIPRGSTASYADVAKTIGRPNAVRAVARACARNPVALVIPCHRVVGKDGSMTGYRWGVSRKKTLLDLER